MFSLTIGSAPQELPDEPADANLTLDQVVSLVEQLEYRQRWLDAFRLDLLSTAVELATGAPRSSENELAYRSLRSELATTLGTSERVAETHMDIAWSLRNDFATTHEVLAAGEISIAHARVVADAGRSIGVGSSPEAVARRESYQAEVLPHARRESVNRLRPIARRIAEQYAVDTLDERHQEEVRRRRVMVHEREDGMSDLLAYLPTAEAYAIHDRLTRIAREVERVERSSRVVGGDGAEVGVDDADAPALRARDEVRADVFAELLLGSDPTAMSSCSSSEAMRARVQVIVPITALEPTAGSGPARSGPAGGGSFERRIPVAELAGAGTIASSSARSIAAAAPVWERVAVDAESGAVLSVDRYRPSEEMRRRLAVRDQHCRFPGCRVPVSRCDLDHTVDAALGGPTSTANLAHLCRGHHVLKHHSDWTVRQRNDGDLHWTSPSGRNYVDRPPSRVRFARTAAPVSVPPVPSRRPDVGWHPF